MLYSQNFLHLRNLNITNKTLLLRNDFNVPMADGRIVDDTRLICSLPSIRYCLEKKAAVILSSHLGRPEVDPDTPDKQSFSLRPIAERLQILLKQPVNFIEDWYQVPEIKPGQLVLMENVRFLEGETANDIQLAKHMASMCDIYVMDAFAAAHRKHASTFGIMDYTKQACAGFLLTEEVEAIGKFIHQPRHPVIAIVGGSKVSTKLHLLNSLARQVDTLIVGGGILNTFIAAAGYPIGKSLYEPDFIEQAGAIANQVKVPLPAEVVVAKSCSGEASASIKTLDQINHDDMILDVTPGFVIGLTPDFNRAETILWNGPLGVCELAPFCHGTRTLAELLAETKAFTLAGGGDTLAAVNQFGVADSIDYLSTGGGAFLELVENKSLPVLLGLSRFVTGSN